MAIRVENVSPDPFRGRDDVTIVWKGGRISKLLFPSGKVISFDHDDTPSDSLTKTKKFQPPVA